MRIRPRGADTGANTPAIVAVPPSSVTPELKRRRFLFTLGLGSAGAAMGAAASVSAIADATEAPKETEESPDGRYRETDHVRDYYRTAKL